ncbi:hypothetical protein [Brucella intermedia]|uniref:hypothetical protein n=1 Tax=Brucella intermedia TaxID=94625 RepID=UPI00224AEB42|nr:hypothetical protein [Brucella intermedia]
MSTNHSAMWPYCLAQLTLVAIFVTGIYLVKHWYGANFGWYEWSVAGVGTLLLAFVITGIFQYVYDAIADAQHDAFVKRERYAFISTLTSVLSLLVATAALAVSIAAYYR